jgi:hypothetical protein
MRAVGENPANPDDFRRAWQYQVYKTRSAKYHQPNCLLALPRIGTGARLAYAGKMATDASPDVERLIDEIYSDGRYASRNDVLVAALSSLRERRNEEPAPPAAGGKSSRRRKWAIAA